MTRLTFTTYIERGECDLTDLEVVVTYTANPFVGATYWQPAEGGDIELDSVKANGVEVDLTDAEEAKIIAECEARVGDDMEDAAGDYDDYQYEQWKDRQMMDAWEASQ